MWKNESAIAWQHGWNIVEPTGRTALHCTHVIMLLARVCDRCVVFSTRYSRLETYMKTKLLLK